MTKTTLADAVRATRWLLLCLLGLWGTLAAAQDATELPARVARLGYVQGNVSFAPDGSDDWTDALENRPLTQGDRLESAPGARAELDLGGSMLRLGGRTRVAVRALDDGGVRLDIPTGRVALHVAVLQSGERLELETPNLTLVVRRPGDYRLDVDDEATQVSLGAGAASVYGEGGSLTLQSGRSVRFYGTGLDRDEDVAPPDDGFAAWVEARLRRAEDLAASRYLSPEMVGTDTLDAYGDWAESGDYGVVWVPRVAAGWAPYRDGRWEWIAPWGWTWIDAAPWGFAPFHYGRWVQWRGRWSWVPGPRTVRPAYAPALVAFVGGSGWSLNVAEGPAVGWFPLGPGEVYRPAGHFSRDYLRRVNPWHRDRDDFDAPPRHYRNERQPGAMTVIPRQDFAAGRPVAPVARKVEWQRLSNAPMPNAVPDIAPVGRPAGAFRSERPARSVPWSMPQRSPGADGRSGAPRSDDAAANRRNRPDLVVPRDDGAGQRQRFVPREERGTPAEQPTGERRRDMPERRSLPPAPASAPEADTPRRTWPAPAPRSGNPRPQPADNTGEGRDPSTRAPAWMRQQPSAPAERRGDSTRGTAAPTAVPRYNATPEPRQQRREISPQPAPASSRGGADAAHQERHAPRRLPSQVNDDQRN